jgi:hypothetical protein
MVCVSIPRPPEIWNEGAHTFESVANTMLEPNSGVAPQECVCTVLPGMGFCWHPGKMRREAKKVECKGTPTPFPKHKANRAVTRGKEIQI